MRKILILLPLFICTFNYAQTVKLNIDAACVKFNKLYGKAFVAVMEADVNYPNSLLQLNPYNGIVEKQISLSGIPKSIELSPDNKHLYLSYQSLKQIDKVDLAEFKIVKTINLGDFQVMDFALLPTNENVLIVCNGKSVVMFKDGFRQPKQVSSVWDFISAICIKNDGLKLYAHNGISTGHEGRIMNIVDDGIEFDGTIWNAMIYSFGYLKSHNDLIYNEFGDIIDAFSDSIPIVTATMPVYKIIGSMRTGYEYSDIHGCYVFGHDNQHEAYISFMDGQYFNYLGSISLGVPCEIVYDLDVVDANHFILVALGYNEIKNSILLYAKTKSKSMIQLKPKIDNYKLETKIRYNN